ncbi:hypothetical protein K450DRAFT_244404 [Umbelopsis ramanniana AG]|uniref:Membrane anchor Opy2 N-terminal domain-containing protein n=1 Tax=Umbelopsis ramanniana AG TaxID=1314678 RepID=A0AAD5E8B6_UMBRA|nr:uncharacterized protein K450DRAFT_244404 [Umbelopsis ramanniana AG]KAI8578978.1 hypothetical protein K450DRAFT_244404 [Umbelopsis ramanniana AG]
MSSSFKKTASISETTHFKLADATQLSATASISSTQRPSSTLSLAASNTISPTNCQPNGCTAICSPTCSSDQVCSLTVMQSCGQCPPSQCINKSAIDLPNASKSPNISASQSPGTNIGLIVGLTVGLGGGLVLLIVLFLCWRRRQKKQSEKNALILPTNISDISGPQPTLSSHSAQNQDPEAIGSAYNSTEKTPVIPNENKVTPSIQTLDQPNIAPAVPTVKSEGGISRSLSLKTKQTQLPQAAVVRSSSMRVTRNEMRRKRLSDNPFDDLEDESKIVLRRAVSVKKSQRYPRSGLDTVDDPGRRPQSELYGSERGSVHSIYSATPAIQVVRAKPVVVRVDSLKGRDGRVTRKASQRRLSSRQSIAAPSQVTSITNTSISQEQPAPDRHSKSANTATTHYTVESQPSEGEITIHWDKKANVPETDTVPASDASNDSEKS